MTEPPAQYGSWPQPEPPPGSELPRPLGIAVKLMYLGALISGIGLFPILLLRDELRAIIAQGLAELGEEVTPDILDAAVAFAIGFAIAIGLLGIGLWILMAVFNGRGKKWARVTATVLGVFGVLFGLTSYTGIGQPNVGFGPILGLLSAILAATILVLLWRPDNAAYYQANSNRT